MLAGSLAFLLGSFLEDRANSAWALLLIGAGWPAQQLSRWLSPTALDTAAAGAPDDGEPQQRRTA